VWSILGESLQALGGLKLAVGRLLCMEEDVPRLTDICEYV
jgi:hypothetical protein